ncbi:hypothetical protein IC229_34820 [Spirosoma sp. BT702]|uniref:Uncharacterized protein n=1 Tax=Spirosoma profusum TaxID=2771354 RepID=A0A927AWQ1_9BACT|nr:hypothetical protein [Spirosoma profusum]MBD2705825.1 hypothetical protein [Spirosoma profusum]
MNSVISTGDRVSVTPYVNGYARKPYKATVIGWTDSGRLRVKTDKDGSLKVVNPDNVKKVADAPNR